MFASLRALLTGIIDYAGLFPPAALPLDQAIQNYARYRKDTDAWMLSRFIIPATQFTDLEPYLEELFDERSSFHFSALGRGGSEQEFQAGLLEDMNAIGKFRERFAKRVLCDVFEVRLPLVPDSVGGLLPGLACYCETAPGSDWCHRASINIAAAQRYAQVAIASGWPRGAAFGFKLRCGGLQASAFPSVEHVAFTIAACRDARVPMKFTAGLHHPIRHFNGGVHTDMHGFINVFVAGVLAHARGLSEEHLRQIIADKDAMQFVFDDSGLRWRDHRATTEEITRARQGFVTSFGSCSFDEPRDDLRALGWM